MNLGSHAINHGLVIGIPILIFSALGLFHRWLDKRNAEISAILQHRDE